MPAEATMQLDSQPQQHKPLDPSHRQQLLDALILYFSNSELNGTVANIPKTYLTENDFQEGWLPATALLTFKRISSLTTNPTDLITTALSLSPQILETSPCGTKLRRRQPYDIRDAAIAFARDTVGLNVVEATGFAPAVTAAEVKTYFGRFGGVKDVTVGSDDGMGEGKKWRVQFEDPGVMIKVLATTHKYEDSRIFVSGRRCVLAAVVPTHERKQKPY
ncbi:hypothetical protein HK097_005407 [Rhizophlyctis rosea]|uniref:HTH La-type RNA-binding domain-containing protein n=1 Tax=Rhizophlyctis rosea TaxID=64517 RepID=A0AAD5S0M1_9FUNG|nr:hypothetical protein HK097_005407 [Rhizophlyctis rosea]